MFTGIVREVGTVIRRERSRDLARLTVSAPKTASMVGPLESVSVNGVCLSVVQLRQGSLVFEVIPETERLTTLGMLRAGARVNVEPSLSITDRLSGHLVLGHVDGTGVVTSVRRHKGQWTLHIRVPHALRRFLVPKGPVTLDGISLTIGQALTASTFTVHLIPETLRQTTLALRKSGDRVNVEVDYFAKLMTAGRRAS